MDSYRFKTVESGKDVLQELYTDTEDRIFSVHILVPIKGTEVTSEEPLKLFVARKYHGPHVFEAANGDRTYRTAGRFTPDGESFVIDVMIPRRESDTVGATISISEEVNEVISRLGLQS